MAFYFEDYGGGVFTFHPSDDDLASDYQQYFEWLWVCDLIAIDYAGLHEELFEWFKNKPDDFRRLNPRHFEILLDNIFRNNGYDTKLGPGVADGGVELHLYRRDEIGATVTLVQAKRYAPHRPIRLEAVAALHGHVQDQKADGGLFVTTSRFLPSARRFAARQGRRLKLVETPELTALAGRAALQILQAKEALVSDRHILRLIRGGGSGLEGKIVHSHYLYGEADQNEFCIVLKETTTAALLMELPTKMVSGIDPKLEHPGLCGFQIPICDDSIIRCGRANNVFRAKREISDGGSVTFWGKRHLYSLWNGKPAFFSSP